MISLMDRWRLLFTTPKMASTSMRHWCALVTRGGTRSTRQEVSSLRTVKTEPDRRIRVCGLMMTMPPWMILEKL